MDPGATSQGMLQRRMGPHAWADELGYDFTGALAI
jgi:hypothetical protein